MPQRKSRLVFSLFIKVVFFGIVTSAALAQGDRDLKEHFLRDAPQRWEDYLHFARQLQVSVNATNYSITNGERSLIHRMRTECRQTVNAALRIHQWLEPDTRGEVEGINPAYSFVLKQDDADRGWFLTELKLFGRLEEHGGRQQAFEEDVLRDVCSCLTLFNLWLPSLVHDPDWKIKSIRTQPFKGTECVWIDFDYPKAKKDYPLKGAMQIKGGWLILDPKHDWILREYTVHSGNPNEATYNRKFDIRERGGQHPIIEKAKTHITIKEDKITEVFGDSEWETKEQSDRPIADFMLSAFGLSEPMGVKPPAPPRTWIWLLATAVAAVLLAMLFAWLKRRHTRSAPRSSSTS